MEAKVYIGVSIVETSTIITSNFAGTSAYVSTFRQIIFLIQMVTYHHGPGVRIYGVYDVCEPQSTPLLARCYVLVLRTVLGSLMVRMSLHWAFDSAWVALANT